MMPVFMQSLYRLELEIVLLGTLWTEFYRYTLMRFWHGILAVPLAFFIPLQQRGALLRDLGPGILCEFLLDEEKKLYRAGKKGRRSRAEYLVPRSR